MWSYAYNGLGQPVAVDAPNGIRTVYTYDARGRLALDARGIPVPLFICAICVICG